VRSHKDVVKLARHEKSFSSALRVTSKLGQSTDHGSDSESEDLKSSVKVEA
jgi:hypothetical protein